MKKRSLRVALPALMVVAVAAWMYLGRHLAAERTVAAIAAQELVFSPALGWVNTAHALPSGPEALLRELRAANKAAYADSAFSFSYSQRMALGIGLTTLETKATVTAELPGNLSDAELVDAAWELFKATSTAFEDAQDDFPYFLYGPAAASGNRPGDLMGNTLGFLAALNHVPHYELQQWLQAMPPAEAQLRANEVLSSTCTEFPALPEIAALPNCPFTQFPGNSFQNKLTILDTETSLNLQ